MLDYDRRQKILQLLEEGNSYRVDDLSEKFNVSKDTIRRDLKKLEINGFIKRIHGGAYKIPGVLFNPSVEHREMVLEKEKKAIGSIANELVKEGDAIFIDSGTTTAELAKCLQKRNIVVVTNAINILSILLNNHWVNDIILTGGKLKKDGLYLMGGETEDQIKHYNFDKLFLGSSGVSIDFGITSPSREEAQVKRKMIDSSKEVILLVDHSKFDQRGLVTYASIDEIDTIVTDWNIDGKKVSKLEEKGINVIVAKKE